MPTNPQFPVDLVTFTEETFNGKLHFLCNELCPTSSRRRRMNNQTEVTRKQSTPNFPKNEHFLPPIRTRMCTCQGVRKLLSYKIWLVLFFGNHLFVIHPFALSPLQWVWVSEWTVGYVKTNWNFALVLQII